jgi:pSer/pThr/pTyr-binding forkhead associated (FHA) protein/DNA-binding CsgD family transcriptional regulator
VPVSPVDPSGASPVELQERIAADRRGDPYLLFRDVTGNQHIVALAGDAERLTVGRAPGCELALAWDNKVSGTHAQLERLGGSDWTISDDGLSRNGSFVNGTRLRHRQRLADGDLLRFGDTQVLYREPIREITATIPEVEESAEVRLSPAQRRVLVALCRPFQHDAEFATPASNRQIADELVLSVEAVKTHIRALFERFGIGDLPRQAKRAELVKRAFQSGAIAQRDLES